MCPLYSLFHLGYRLHALRLGLVCPVCNPLHLRHGCLRPQSSSCTSLYLGSPQLDGLHNSRGLNRRRRVSISRLPRHRRRQNCLRCPEVVS